MEGAVGRNLAADVDHNLAAVVGRIPVAIADHIPAAVAGRNPVDDLAHNPVEEVVGHRAVGRIPGWVEGEIADRIHLGRHIVQRAVLHTDLAVRHGGTPVHLGCRMKNR